MFVWTGCRLPESFEREIRREFLRANEDFDLDVSGFTLPQHISLKISFDAGDRYPEILDLIEGLLRREVPLSVIPTGIEQHGRILWITFRENGTPRRLHNILDRELWNAFGIPQHLFDRAFIFHSALCLGGEDQLRVMRERLADHPLPKKLEIDRFLRGLSESGTSGSYRVVREISNL